VNNGVASNVEVHLKFPAKFTLSKRVWPFKHMYNFQDWTTLNELQEGELIDFIGRVRTPPEDVSISSLRKATLTLTNGNLEQRVILLGQQAGLAVRADDVVAFSGLRINVFRQTRTLETLSLTAVEVNPTARDEIPVIDDIDDDQPVKKAMRLSNSETLTAIQVHSYMSQMLSGPNASDRHFILVGSFKLLTDSFFTDDAPFIEKNDAIEMLWQTVLTDATGEVSVSVWNNGCHVVFGESTSIIHELWSKGEQSETQRSGLLTRWNKCLQLKFRCVCTAKVWKEQRLPRCSRSAVNVNEVEVEDSDVSG